MLSLINERLNLKAAWLMSAKVSFGCDRLRLRRSNIAAPVDQLHERSKAFTDWALVLCINAKLERRKHASARWGKGLLNSSLQERSCEKCLSAQRASRMKRHKPLQCKGL